MTSSWINRKISRIRLELSALIWGFRLRAWSKRFVTPKGDDENPGSDAIVPAYPPKFPPSLVAANGFHDVREKAYYGWTNRRPR